MKTSTGTKHIAREHPELLKDESSLSGGNCQSAAWPSTAEEASRYMRECVQDRVPVTVSGARTGIAGGAVPMGGAVISTEHIRGIEPTQNEAVIRVRAGETLDSVAQYCEKHRPDYFYPPDPTETSASIGGTVATDASGSSSYAYGSTRNWVDRLTVVLPSGPELVIKRGEHRFIGGRLNHPLLGRLILPNLRIPQPAKNAAGLYIKGKMDLIDLFIGSEGQLGVIVEADLILRKKPCALASFAVFCNAEQFWRIREDLMGSSLRVRELEAMVPPCISFLRRNTDFTAHAKDEWVLITSIEASTEKELDTVLESLDVMLEGCGISPDSTWGGFDAAERKRLKDFRHLLPETVNRLIAGLSAKNPAIHKISTDTAVPPRYLETYYGYMTDVLRDTGVEHVLFGHCGQGHLHANLIPADQDDLKRAEKAVELIAERAVQNKGTVSAEHGTGKLKQNLLDLMYSQKEMEQMNLLVDTISRVR